VPKNRLDREAQRHLAAARKALSRGDLTHAAAHTGDALLAAPALPEAHELIARLAEHPEGGRDLYRLDPPLALATVLARAHILACDKDFDRALDLLCKVQEYTPATAWADVLWVTDPATASAVSVQTVTSLAGHLLELIRRIEATGSLESLRRAMAPYLRLVRNTIAVHPDNANLLGLAGYLYRRYDLAEAADYASRADRLNPSLATAIGLGYIYKDMGCIEEALTAWQRAVGYDPGFLPIYDDIADLLLDTDRLEEARGYAERALAIEQDYVYARSVILVVQFRQTREETYLDALMALYKAQPDGSREQGCVGSAIQRTGMKTAE